MVVTPLKTPILRERIDGALVRVRDAYPQGAGNVYPNACGVGIYRTVIEYPGDYETQRVCSEMRGSI